MPASVQALQMRRDGVGIEVGVAAAVRRVGVGLVQPGRARPEGAVDEQVACQPAGARRRRSGSRPARGRSPLRPSSRRSRRRGRVPRSSRQSSMPPMSGPAHSCTATIPLAAARSSAATRAAAPLLGGQQVAGGGADQVVGVGGQRALRRRSPAPPARPGVSRRSAVDATAGMDVDAGQVGGPVADHARRGRRCSAACASGQPDSSQPCPQIGPSGCARARTRRRAAGSAAPRWPRADRGRRARGRSR